MMRRIAASYVVIVVVATAASLVSLPQGMAQGDPGAALRHVALVAGSALAVAALGAAGVALYWRQNVKAPLRALTQTIRQPDAGKLLRQAYGSDLPEVTELAAVLDETLRQLRGTILSLESQRGRMAAILAHMADGILIVDSANDAVLVNPAAERMLGVAAETAVGRSFVEAVRDYELVELVRQAMAGGRAAEPRMVSVGLPPRHLQAMASPIPGEQGTLVLVVLQDISERRRAEIVRRDFVANVSHELRTPIASLKALVETLESGALEDPAVGQDFLGRMHVEVDELAQLVEELLELSRIESGRVELRLEAVDLAEIVARAVERLRAQAERQGVALEFAAESSLPPVRADATRVEQVVINLVHNGVKFTPPGGKVAVSVAVEHRGQEAAPKQGMATEAVGKDRAPEDQGGRVTVSVRDTGVGLLREDLPRIFERFYKADKSRASRGTGLGLAIAKHTVQAHGGEIWARSDGPGEGATFTFTLPVAQVARSSPV